MVYIHVFTGVHRCTPMVIKVYKCTKSHLLIKVCHHLGFRDVAGNVLDHQGVVCGGDLTAAVRPKEEVSMLICCLEVLIGYFEVFIGCYTPDGWRYDLSVSKPYNISYKPL